MTQFFLLVALRSEIPEDLEEQISALSAKDFEGLLQVERNCREDLRSADRVEDPKAVRYLVGFRIPFLRLAVGTSKALLKSLSFELPLLVGDNRVVQNLDGFKDGREVRKVFLP